MCPEQGHVDFSKVRVVVCLREAWFSQPKSTKPFVPWLGNGHDPVVTGSTGRLTMNAVSHNYSEGREVIRILWIMAMDNSHSLNLMSRRGNNRQ